MVLNRSDDIVLTFEGDTENDSFLLRAAYLGDTAQIESLLKAGANVNAIERLYHINPGHTPLCFAAQENHLGARPLQNRFEIQPGDEWNAKNLPCQFARSRGFGTRPG